MDTSDSDTKALLKVMVHAIQQQNTILDRVTQVLEHLTTSPSIQPASIHASTSNLFPGHAVPPSNSSKKASFDEACDQLSEWFHTKIHLSIMQAARLASTLVLSHQIVSEEQLYQRLQHDPQFLTQALSISMEMDALIKSTLSKAAAHYTVSNGFVEESELFFSAIYTKNEEFQFDITDSTDMVADKSTAVSNNDLPIIDPLGSSSTSAKIQRLSEIGNSSKKLWKERGTSPVVGTSRRPSMIHSMATPMTTGKKLLAQLDSDDDDEADKSEISYSVIYTQDDSFQFDHSFDPTEPDNNDQSVLDMSMNSSMKTDPLRRLSGFGNSSAKIWTDRKNTSRRPSLIQNMTTPNVVVKKLLLEGDVDVDQSVDEITESQSSKVETVTTDSTMDFSSKIEKIILPVSIESKPVIASPSKGEFSEMNPMMRMKKLKNSGTPIKANNTAIMPTETVNTKLEEQTRAVPVAQVEPISECSVSLHLILIDN